MTNSEVQSGPADYFSRDVLEFSGVIDLLRGFLTGPIALSRLGAIEPVTEMEKINRDLALVKEAREFMADGSRPGFSGLKDPRASLEKLSIEGIALDPHEILGLVEVAR